jgi:hypothetical protein
MAGSDWKLDKKGSDNSGLPCQTWRYMLLMHVADNAGRIIDMKRRDTVAAPTHEEHLAQADW